MENKNYSITHDSIIIHTTASGINLYETSKILIDENSILIDENIRAIRQSESYLKMIEKYDLDKTTFKIILDRINFLNTFCLYLNFNCDLSINLRELFLSKTRLEQISFIRHIYVELFRHLERMKKENKYIYDLCNNYGIINEFNNYAKLKRTFIVNYSNNITKHRNNLFAHIDKCKDYNEYLDEVQTFDAEDVGKMCIQFLNSQNLLSKIFSSLNKLMYEKLIEINNELTNKNTKINQDSLLMLEKLKDKITKEQYNQMKNTLNDVLSLVNIKK